MSVLAIDAGTTGVTALVVTPDGTHRGARLPGVPPALPPAGLGRARAGGDLAGHPRGDPRLPGAWDGETPTSRRRASPTSARRCCSGTARRSARPRRAIVWQDRRTAHDLHAAAGRGPRGAGRRADRPRLDPYFSGTKLVWLAENEPNTWALVEPGRYAIGTVDSYLVARMTRGTWHVTDVSNACRTLLFDLEQPATGPTSSATCSACPATRCPRCVPNWGELATTDPQRVPRPRAAGRRASPATSRRRCSGRPASTSGDSKCTYGTGSFILTNTGTEVVRSDAGLLSTAAWRSPDGALTYALEGAVFVTGAAVQWLRDGLADRRLGGGDRGHRRHRARHRRRRLRARAHRAWAHPTGTRTRAAPSWASPAARRAPTSCARRSRRSPSRSAT